MGLDGCNLGRLRNLGVLQRSEENCSDRSVTGSGDAKQHTFIKLKHLDVPPNKFDSWDLHWQHVVGKISLGLMMWEWVKT